jgi:exopolysaccharide biosynthesis WecB/TagA/CpsF family protein
MSALSRPKEPRPQQLERAKGALAAHRQQASAGQSGLAAALAKLAAVQRSIDPKSRSGSQSSPSSFQLLGVRIDNVTMNAAISRILDAVDRPDFASFAFVNADCLNIASSNRRYRNILAGQKAVFADGSGIALVSRLRGICTSENVNGTDMFPLLCQAAAAHDISIFLLGAAPGVAGRVAANMSAEYPDLTIAGTHHGFFNETEEESVIALINQSGADILLVAMGAPQQELWIAANRGRLIPKVAIGVGGLFDFFSGRVWRAPAAMRRTGLEWVWRLMQEPGRLWRRYVLGNPLFLARCLAEQVADLFKKNTSAPPRIASERVLPARERAVAIAPSTAGAIVAGELRS